MSGLSVRYVEDGLLVTEIDGWGWWRLALVPYEFLDDSGRLALATGAAGALAGLGETSGHLLVVRRRHDPDRWAAQLAGVSDGGPGWVTFHVNRLFAAVVGLLAAASAGDPLLLLLDDLHWADKPTLTLLRHLVGASLPMRVLVLGTYRQSELSKDHPLTETLAALHREAGVTRLPLTGLDDVDVLTLMETGAGHELPGSFVDLAHAVRRETDGNPFFVLQLLRHLAEGGWLYQDDAGRWRARAELAELTLPDSVREVVEQRVSRLGDEVGRLLSIAAVIGRDFDAQVLAPVAGIAELEMVDILDRGVNAGLLTDVAPGRYSFAHAVIQHAVYEGLTATRRSLLHSRVAETLESLYGEGPGPRVGEVARHWLAATRPGDVTRALAYAQWAGEAALAALAPEEAARCFSQALELSAPEGVADDHLRAELLIGLGTARRRAGDPASRETLLTAARLAQSLGDTERLIRAALANSRGVFSHSGVVDEERVAVLNAALAAGTGDTPDRALLLATLAVELTFTGDWPHRRALALEALAMARRVGDSATLQRVTGVVYFSICVPETLDERLAITAEALASAEGQSDPVALHWVHRWRLYACADAGDIDGVDAHLPEVIRYGEATRDPYVIWTLTLDKSGRRLLAGDLGEAEREATEGFRIATASGQPEAAAAYVISLFEIRRQQGRLSEMETALTEAADQNPGITGLRAILATLYCELGNRAAAAALLRADAADGFAGFPYDLVWLYGVVNYAEVAAALQEHAPARALYDRLAPWHRQLPTIPLVVNAGAVAMYLGMLATVLDRLDDAESHFAEAMEIHERLRAPYWVGRTQLERARTLLIRRQPGDAELARDIVGAALATAREFSLANLDRRAAELLQDCP